MAFPHSCGGTKFQSCLISGRWNALVAVIFAAMVSGTSYAFGIFSEILKDRLGFRQVDVALIGSFGSTGLYMGVFCGIAIEYTGPKLLILLGGLCMFCGNFYMWLAVLKHAPHSLPMLCVANYVAQLGVACSSSSVTTVGIRLFPTSVTGQVAGICKAYFGVSAAVLATVASSFFRDESTNFMLFVAISLPACQLLGALNVNFLPPHLLSFRHERILGHSYSLVPFVRHLASLMLLVLVIGALTHWATLHGKTKAVLGSVVLAAVFSVWLLPALYGPRYLTRGEAGLAEDEGGERADEDATDSLLAPSGAAAVEGKGGTVDGGDKQQQFVSFFGRHVPLREVARHWRSHVLMVLFMCVSGSGLLVINNVQAVAQAVHQNPSSFFVTLLALANASGRVLVGLTSDAWAHRLSRLQIQGCVCLVMALAQAVLSFGVSALLYPCLLLVGTCFGATFSNIAALVADLFGSQHVGANYGFIDMAPIAGSYAFATGLIALFYPGDLSEGDDDDDSAQDECVGAHCFRAIFWTTSTACLVASGLAFFLHSQTPIIK